MFINVLECRADGTQEIVRREVADDYFDAPSEEAEEAEEAE